MLGEEQHEVATMGEGNIAVAVGMKNVSSLSLSLSLAIVFSYKADSTAHVFGCVI